MRVFVTGASGFIGSAAATALARAGHDVVGLVRSEEKARALAQHEVRAVIGALDAPEAWREHAAAADALVHCAKESSPRGFELDRRAIRALIDAAASGAPRTLVYTSGVWVYGDTQGRRVDEGSPRNPLPLVAQRVDSEDLVLAAQRGALRTVVLRPGCVYGGSGSLTASWFASASDEGAARLVGDGENRWAMVHRDDLADLYVRALESGHSGVFNATEEQSSTVRACAEAASRAAGAGGRVVVLPLAEAREALGGFADALALTQRVESKRALELCGWKPMHAGFVDGVERYFAAWRASRS